MPRRNFYQNIPVRRRTILTFVLAGIHLQSCSSSTEVTSVASLPVLVPVSLTAYFNNKGIGSAPGQADFDGSGNAYPVDQFPSGSITINNIPFQFPGASSGSDNVVAIGQTIPLPEGNYLQASLLVSASYAYGAAAGTATTHYRDGSTSSAYLAVPDWYAGTDGVLTSPYYYSPTGTEQHGVSIFEIQLPFDQTKIATAVTLPTTTLPAPNIPSIHIFALTLLPVTRGYAVRILDAHSTTKIATDTTATQIVEATVENTGSEWFTSSYAASVSVLARGVRTVMPALISRLGPGEQARVEIGIENAPSLATGTQVTGTVRATLTGGNTDTLDFPLTAGVPSYTATDASLTQHRAPEWYNNAKFGIFIHWGVYSVPAWAPVNASGASTDYAEWYWYSMDNASDLTYQHHLQTYGQHFHYDDFIPWFTAAHFNPHAWVQLFQQAGARYFVLVAKHHDGFALFKSQYSQRNAVDLGPHRDLVQELFDAAATYTPGMKRGVYYSLPEWYNPSYPGGGSFPGGGPHNPYTGLAIPYTGYLPVRDYVQDFQKPQILELIDHYAPDLIWWDMGGPNDTNAVLAYYFNQARTANQQVATNNRGGVAAYDFTITEYSTYAHLTTSKWEATRGIDPFSFGYNAATALAAYATADQLITSLVDIVSKNGNLLLDIGPAADGTIPAIMQQRLQEIGAWLQVNGEAIYDTTYWWRTPQDGNLRFTIRPNTAFYILSLVPPGNQLVVNQPVPIQSCNTITMLGYNEGSLTWSEQGSALTIDVPPAAQQAGQHAWVFKIDWRSC